MIKTKKMVFTIVLFALLASESAVASDAVFIAYYDAMNKDLKFAKSADGGAMWTVTKVDSAGDVGQYLSLHGVGADKLFISYWDATNAPINSALKFAKSTDGGATWPAANIKTVDSNSGIYTSIHAVDANTIFISYTGAGLRFAKSTDGGTTWTTKTVDNDLGNMGTDTSIHATDASTIFIGYKDAGDDNIKVAKSTDGGTTWITKAVENNAFGGYINSIYAADANTIFMSYVGSGTGGRKFAKSTDGGDTWTSFTAADGQWMSDTSIHAAGSSLFISYNHYDFSVWPGINMLKFAKSTDGGATWTTNIVDSPVTSQHNSIYATDASKIYVGYNDYGREDLKFAKSTDGGATWASNTVDSTGNVGQYASIYAVSLTLFVTASASPSSGIEPLNNVQVTADVSGTVAGSIEYKLDCTNDGTWEQTATNTNDPYTFTATCSYPTAGSYTAKVQATRQSIVATATATITVTAPPCVDGGTCTTEGSTCCSSGKQYTCQKELTVCSSGADYQIYSSTSGSYMAACLNTKNPCSGYPNDYSDISQSSASSLCATGTHMCSADEYAARGGQTTEPCVSGITYWLGGTYSSAFCSFPSPHNRYYSGSGNCLSAGFSGTFVGNTCPGTFINIASTSCVTNIQGAMCCGTPVPSTALKYKDTGACVLPTLSVTASASPSTGVEPLNNVQITADVSGTATGNIEYKLDCTNDGTWEQTVTNTNDPYTFTATCSYPTAGSYTAKVQATRQSIVATATAPINAVSPTLFVTASASPSTGVEPLNNVQVTADVSGTVAGSIEYKLDCANDGTWEQTVTNANDPYTFTAKCSYATAGTYTAKVQATRQSIVATATATITVTAPPCVDGGTCTTEGSACCAGGRQLTCQKAPTLCASGADYQTYSSGMAGCILNNANPSASQVIQSSAASLCASGAHLCSPTEYLSNGGGTIFPIRDYWLSGTAYSNMIECIPPYDVFAAFVGGTKCLEAYGTGPNRYNSCAASAPTGWFLSMGCTDKSGAMCCGTPVPSTALKYKDTGACATLFVTASASPSTGVEPLNNVQITADVSGTATGNIEYKLDCTNDGTWEQTVTNANDPYTFTATCSYPTAGSYTAKVQATRQSVVATATAPITVAAGPCKYSLALNKKADRQIASDYTWTISATDSSTSSCTSSITYSISYKKTVGCTSVNIPASLAIAKGGTAAFNVAIQRATSGVCNVAFTIKAPDNTVVDPDFTIAASAANLWTEVVGDTSCPAPPPPAAPSGMKIDITYPFAEKKMVSMVTTAAGLAPDFTKTMPIGFLVKAKTLSLIPVECNGVNCELKYGIKGVDATLFTPCSGAYVPGQCTVFERLTPIGPAWKAERPSKSLVPALDLACDTDYTLVVKTTITSGHDAGSSGTLETPVHINCNPKLTVDPPEKAVVLGQNSMDAFTVAIWDPQIAAYTLSLSSKPEHSFLTGADKWVKFKCSSAGCSDLSWSGISTGGATAPQLTVQLTGKASTKAGNFPVFFKAASSSSAVTSEATIKVFAEGLNEFAAWQLAVMILLSAVIVSRLPKKMR